MRVICTWLLLQLPLPSLGFFRLFCAKPITIERADPIVNYGQVSGHVHTVMGASGFSANATTDSIRKSRCSTCIVNEDMSNYWIPTLFYQYGDGSVESVQQVGGMLVYYFPTGDAFPEGLHMLAGSSGRRSFEGSREEKAISYRCLDYTGDMGPETPAFPQRNCKDGLRVQVMFPSCWDGQNLDSSDHKSHMAYDIPFRGCPASHPKRLTTIFYEIIFATGKYKDEWLDEMGKPKRAMPFFFSSGDNTGYGLHGDFMNGWDRAVLQRAMEDCRDNSGVVERCQHFTFRKDMGSCMPEFQTATDEQVEGQMKAPPGLAPIPVANFDPCGESPTAGREIDQSLSGQPLGTCSGSFSGIAYQHPTVTMDDELVGSTVDVKRNPDPIDKLGYLGCFRDNDGGRTLEQYFGNGFTPKTCRAKVQSESSTHIVFALQYGGECRASASATSYRAQGLSADCTMSCSANELLICGGPNANQVYAVHPTSPPSPPSTTSTSTWSSGSVDGFTPLDGGVDRVCRGAHPGDNSDQYYVKFSSITSLGACKQLCTQNAACVGIEYQMNLDACEVWTRSGGIGATMTIAGSVCYRFEAFEPADDGVDRACRGSSSSDNSAAYYSLRSASSLEECKTQCKETAACKGIEFKGQRCEVWIRPEGIHATAMVSGFTCFRYVGSPINQLPDDFEALDGGVDRACRGSSSSDNSAAYYSLRSASSLEECKTQCKETQACKGIEFKGQRCEVWIRPEGIHATAFVSGFTCLRYAGASDTNALDAIATGVHVKRLRHGRTTQHRLELTGKGAGPLLLQLKAMEQSSNDCGQETEFVEN